MSGPSPRSRPAKCIPNYHQHRHQEHETTRPDESDLPLESLGECRTGERYAGLWDRLSDNHEWHEEAKGATTVSHFLRSQIRWVAHVRAPRMARSHLLLPFKLYARQA